MFTKENVIGTKFNSGGTIYVCHSIADNGEVNLSMGNSPEVIYVSINMKLVLNTLNTGSWAPIPPLIQLSYQIF